MKTRTHFLALICVIFTLMLSACASAPGEPVAERTEPPIQPSDTQPPPSDTPAPPTDSLPPPTDTPVPPTATRTRVPTSTKKPTDMNVPITSESELAGFWMIFEKPNEGTSLIRFSEDGTFGFIFRPDWFPSSDDPSKTSTELMLLFTMIEEDPVIWGEFWFEDGQLHIKDIGNRGVGYWHWAECDSIGIYQPVLLQPDAMQPKTVTDSCNFARDYAQISRNEMLGRIWQRVALTAE